MKNLKLFLLAFCLLPFCAQAQDFTEKPVTTTIKEVTIFTEGCQIIRQQSVDLPQGNLLLKFTGLSPFIDPKSVQVKTDGDLTVLSVNHQTDHLKSKDKDKEFAEIETKINEINEKLLVENAHKTSLNDELAFLTANIKVTGTAQTANVQQIKDAYAFYKEKTNEIRLKILEKDKVLKELEKERAKYQAQLNASPDKKEFPLSEILVKIENKKAGKFSFELSYMASNAGWIPTYDIVAKTIDEPLRLIYKANIRQDTKEDWKNVKLRLSSANPKKSGVAPQLRPYFVAYGLLPPVYTGETGNANQLSGRIYDAETNEPVAFANVVIQGTTIGTTSDDKGYYTISLPNQTEPLYVKFSSVTHEEQIVAVNSRQTINVSLRPDNQVLESVVVMGYGTQKKQTVEEALQGRVSGVKVSSSSNIRVRGNSSVSSGSDYSAPVSTQQVRRQTSVDFEIKTPYNIPSDGKSYTVSVEEYSIDADFEYYCAPKADKDVFLTASFDGWEDLNLLEGEANIFFENTYIGKTLIDTRISSDTLSISLGRDKGVSVTRQLQKNFSSKGFLGSKKEETRTWKITVRNNKQSAINLQLVDQLPVARTNDVEVKQQNISGAKLNDDTGELSWRISLPAKQNRDFELKYQVRYPKNWNMVVE